MRKALGWLMLVIGVSGIAISFTGLIAGRRLVASLEQSLHRNLTLTIDSLDTVRQSLIVTRSTVQQLEVALETAHQAADSASNTISETQPLLTDGSQVVTRDVPHSIETFQSSLPALIEVAGAVDSAMRTLSAFRINRSILGFPLNFDLGVDYDPDVPFDQSVAELGATLEGVPQELRALEDTIETTNDNLQTISQDISDLGTDLEDINESIKEAQPIVDEYMTIVTDLSDSARRSRLLLDRQMAPVNLAITLLTIWFGLAQIAPLYLGWELVAGHRRQPFVHGDEVVAIAESTKTEHTSTLDRAGDQTVGQDG